MMQKVEKISSNILYFQVGGNPAKMKGCKNENTMSSPNTKFMIIFQNKILTHADVSS